MYRDCFLEMIKAAKASDFSEREIADAFGMTIVELRRKKSDHNYMNRMRMRVEALEMKLEGKSIAEIATALDKQESTVRLLLDKEANDKMEAAHEARLRGEKPKMWSPKESIELGKIVRKAEEAEKAEQE